MFISSRLEVCRAPRVRTNMDSIRLSRLGGIKRRPNFAALPASLAGADNLSRAFVGADVEQCRCGVARVKSKVDPMSRTAFAPRLILPDGRFRHILDRVDPFFHDQPAWPVAITAATAVTPRGPAAWQWSAGEASTAQRQQVVAFLIGFAASIAVVLAAVMAQPLPKSAEVPAAAQPAVADAGRIATFATPTLLPRINVAKVTVIADEAASPVPAPTAAFAQTVAPVVVSLAAAAPIPTAPPAPTALATPSTGRLAAPPASSRAKITIAASPVRIVKAEAKPLVVVRPVGRPSAQMTAAMIAPPLPIGARAPVPPPSSNSTWSNDWMRSSLGMGPNAK